MDYSSPEWQEIVRKSREEYAAEQRRKDAARATGETCGGCGKKFTDDEQRFNVSEWGSPFVVMCGKCAPEWLTSGRGKPMRIIPSVDVHVWPCAGCGREVVFGMSSRQYRKRVYCSDRCREDYARRSKSKGNSEPHEKTCEVCGETFTPARSDAKTCSAACRQKAYRQRARA